MKIAQITKNQLRLDSEIKQVSVKHKVLARQIFYPLYQRIVYIEQLSNRLPSIIFTVHQIYDSLHYEEGLKHLKQAIPDFEDRLSQIENRIKMYDEDSKNFHGYELRNSVMDFIKENGFRLLEDKNENPSIIAIDLSILLPELISYWFKDKPDIKFIHDDNYVKIYGQMGHAEIARINNEQDRMRVRGLVEQLKNFDYIKDEFNKFYQEITDIYKLAENLSQDIGKNIIKFIEVDEYDNICKICETSHVP